MLCTVEVKKLRNAKLKKKKNLAKAFMKVFQPLRYGKLV